MTFDNEFINEHNAKVLKLTHFGTALHGLGELLAYSVDDRATANEHFGQMTIRIDREQGKILLGLNLLGSKCRAYVSISNSHITPRFEECSYIGIGRFNTDVVPDSLAMSPTVVGASSSNQQHWFLHESADREVLQLNLTEYPIRKAIEATIDRDGFRNLLNKLGKAEGYLRLFLKDETLAGVTSVENDTAKCVSSHYKARNVTVIGNTKECSTTVHYWSLYQFLYRRKVGKTGLFLRNLIDESANEDMKFGILDTGDFFLEMDLFTERPSKLTIVIPDDYTMGLSSYEDIIVNVKASKKTKNKTAIVRAGNPAELTVVTTIEEPAQVSSLTEEEQTILESWREVHESRGGSSSNPIDWWAEYTLSVLQEGQQIPDAAFALAAKLASI